MAAIYEIRPDGLLTRHPVPSGAFHAARSRDGWSDTGERLELDGWPEPYAEVWETADGSRFLWAPPVPLRAVAA